MGEVGDAVGVVEVGSAAAGCVCEACWVPPLFQFDDEGDSNLDDATPAPALLEPEVVLPSDDLPSDEDSDSLADIGINDAARPSDVDWVD